MISRRLLRTKALIVLYAYDRRGTGELPVAEKELIRATEKAYDLYLYLLALYIELADLSLARMEIAMNKRMPTDEDLNPRRRFVDNPYITYLRESPEFNTALVDHKISWSGNSEIIRLIYNEIADWTVFDDYLNGDCADTPGDRKLLYQLLTRKILSSDNLISHLEDSSIYWNDDLDFAALMIGKTLRRIKLHDYDGELLLPLFRDDDDREFVKELLRNAILKSKFLRDLIERSTTNWEIERIALMDILVMQLALTEIIVFPEIPVKVTLNEYIEVSKYYCTPKSSTFINGILDKIVKEMRQEELFVKSGRGLVGEGTGPAQ